MAVLSLEWSRIRIQPSRQDEFLWGMKFLSFDRMMLSLSTGCYAKLVSCKCQMLGAAASLQQKKWKRGFFLCKFSCWMSQNPSQHFATRKVHGSWPSCFLSNVNTLSIYMFLTECIKSHASSSNIRRNKDVRPRGQQHLQYCDGRNGNQLIAWPWLRQTSEQREKYKVPAWCLEACSC